jgi:hypothetical protein
LKFFRTYALLPGLLGEIQGKVQGLLQHNVLLLDQVGLPLGLLAQQYWTRNGGQDLPPDVELLVRVHQPRHLEVIASQQLHKLPQVYPHLGDYGPLSVTVERQNRAVQLVLNLRAGAVNVYPDKDLSPSQHKTQGLSLGVAQEVACIDLNTQ